MDFFAIVPFYLELALVPLGSSAVIRVLRLIRIFRLLKSPKTRHCVDMRLGEEPRYTVLYMYMYNCIIYVDILYNLIYIAYIYCIYCV